MSSFVGQLYGKVSHLVNNCSSPSQFMGLFFCWIHFDYSIIRPIEFDCFLLRFPLPIFINYLVNSN